MKDVWTNSFRRVPRTLSLNNYLAQAPQEDEKTSKSSRSHMTPRERALRQRRMTCPRKRVVNDDGELEYHLYELNEFEDKQFLQYGIGTAMYFMLLKRLAVVFSILMLMVLPAMIIYGGGNDPISEEYGILATTLGHWGTSQTNSTDEIYGSSKMDLGIVLTIFDLLYCFFILAAMWMLKSVFAKVIGILSSSISYTTLLPSLSEYTRGRSFKTPFFHFWIFVIILFCIFVRSRGYSQMDGSNSNQHE